MTSDDMIEAVGKHLESMPDCPPVAWPDTDFTPNGPYIELRHSPGNTFDDTIDAAGEIQEGIFLITAVAPSGDRGRKAGAIETKIRAQFPKALRLPAGDGNIVIQSPASPGTPFQDGTYFRKPVRVFYITE